MKTKYSKLLIICILLSGLASGQAIKKGNEAYDLMQYGKAIKYYKEVLKKDPQNYEAASKLAHSYENTRQYDQMLYTYENIVNSPNVQKEDYYNIAKAYMMYGKIKDAKKYADIYSSKSPNQKAEYLNKSIQNMPEWLRKVDDYIQDMTTGSSISTYSVMSPTLQGANLLVTIESPHKDKDEWGSRHYTEVYNMTNSLQLGNSFLNLKGWNSKYESQQAVDNSDNIYYFTTNHNEPVGEDKYEIYNLKICYIDLSDENKTIHDFKYNDVSYNVCHPAISPDGNLLVFASDMSGGKGGLDLYYCLKSTSGWSQPKNIEALNSFGNEKLPSFIDKGKVAYSSDALPGMGGMDIFIAEYSGTSFSLPINPGYPVNSHYNDFGLASTNFEESGYLTTNRNSKEGRYEVIHYTQKVTQTISEPTQDDEKRLNILVLDKYTDIPLDNVNISLSRNGQVWKTLSTNEEGKASIMLPKGTLVDISGNKNGISTTTADVGNIDYQSSDAVIFKKLYHNDPRFTLVGEVRERKTKNPVSDVLVKLDNESQGMSKEANSDIEGSFRFQLEQNSDFTVKGIKEGIYSNSKTITTKGLDRTTTLYAKLYLNVDIICLGNNLVIEDIYYDYDKWDIRADAKPSLDQLLTFLNDYPDMKIELSSHTDKRGSEEYNETLSQKRAESCRTYLINKGISTSRIIAKGYGEHKPAVECQTCTEAQHQANRRTEVEILECPSCPSCD